MLPSTRTRYYASWKRILGFVWRTQLWDPDRDPLPPYELTPDQADALDDLFDLGGRLRADAATGQPPPSQLALLDRGVLRLYLCLLIHPLEGPPYESAVLSALAVMAVKPPPGAAPYGPVPPLTPPFIGRTAEEAGFRWATP